MNTEDFRQYLQKQHSTRSGHGFSPKVASDCISRCRRVEALIGQSMDDLVKGKTSEAVANLIDSQCDKSIGSGVLRDLQSAARRYHEYRHQVAN